MENLITIKEASLILRRPKSAIYRLVRMGELKHIKDGPKLIKFSRAHLEAYIQSRDAGSNVLPLLEPRKSIEAKTRNSPPRQKEDVL